MGRDEETAFRQPELLHDIFRGTVVTLITSAVRQAHGPEPLGLEPYGRELRAERLRAERLGAERRGRGLKGNRNCR